MLKIRLLRIGRKHQPSYKIIVVDSRRGPKSGKFIEQLGFYNPITKEKGLKTERVEYWLSKGAQLSDVIHNLLVSEGIIKGKKIAVHSTKQKEEAKEEAKEEEETAQEPKQEESKTENPKTEEKKPKKEKTEPATPEEENVEDNKTEDRQENKKEEAEEKK